MPGLWPLLKPYKGQMALLVVLTRLFPDVR